MHFNYRYFETETPKGTSSADNWLKQSCYGPRIWDNFICYGGSIVSVQILLVHQGSGGSEVVLTWRHLTSLKRMSSTSILYVGFYSAFWNTNIHAVMFILGFVSRQLCQCYHFIISKVQSSCWITLRVLMNAFRCRNKHVINLILVSIRSSRNGVMIIFISRSVWLVVHLMLPYLVIFLMPLFFVVSDNVKLHCCLT
jgi:hypothetical protein